MLAKSKIKLKDVQTVPTHKIPYYRKTNLVFAKELNF